jgi:hypothetical protein
MKTTALGTLGLLAAAVAGCNGTGLGGAGTCLTYGACGGEALGNWTLQEGCVNLVVKPYQQLSLPEQMRQPQDPTLEPPQPTPTTSGSWCSDLVYQPADTTAPIKSVVLWHGPLDLRGGTLFHNADAAHTYTATIVFGAPQETFFPAECLGTYQAAPDAGADEQDQCTALEAALVKYLKTQPSFKFTDTVDADGGTLAACVARDGGCNCKYDYQLISADSGVWEVDPQDRSVIIHHGKNSSEPQRSTFCAPADGQTLKMSGIGGTSMLNQQGLRSLSYVKMATSP